MPRAGRMGAYKTLDPRHAPGFPRVEESTLKRALRPIASQRPRYFVRRCSRRWRSIVRAICSCSSAIFVKPFLRRCFARARCHSGVARASSWRGFLGSSSIDIFCPQCGTRPAGRKPRACISLHRRRGAKPIMQKKAPASLPGP
jgi:hypothetical protein